MPVRASADLMGVWAGGSDHACVAVPSIWSLVSDVAAYVDTLASWADVVVASNPAVFASAVVATAAG